MKAKLNRIKGVNLTTLIKKMLLMDNQVYLTATDDELLSSVYLVATKDVVKTTKVKLSEIFVFDKPLDKSLRLPFFDGAKVINALQYFNMTELHGEISYIELDGDYHAETLIIKDNSLKIKLSCQDPDLGFISMTTDQLETVFSDKAKKYGFDLPEIDLQKIVNLNGMDKSELFSIYGDADGIHASGTNYDYIIDDTVKGTFEKVSLHKKMLARIDKESYSIQVCTGEQNKVLLTSKNSNTSIALNLAMGVEETV